MILVLSTVDHQQWRRKTALDLMPFWWSYWITIANHYHGLLSKWSRLLIPPLHHQSPQKYVLIFLDGSTYISPFWHLLFLILNIIQMISPVFLDTVIYIKFDLKYKTTWWYFFNNGNRRKIDKITCNGLSLDFSAAIRSDDRKLCILHCVCCFTAIGVCAIT